MKRLFLLRHAKSSWKQPSLADFDRPLNKRGRTAAGLMAKYMAARKLRPDLILCSASQRTCETLTLMLPDIGSDSDIRIEESLYHASAEQMVAEVATADPNHQAVMIVGHNPGLAELALWLARAGDREAKRRLREKFPTGALAVIDNIGDSWDSLTREETRLERLVCPRDLHSGAAAMNAPVSSVSHS